MTHRPGPATLYTSVVGALLTMIGLVGFLHGSNFATGDSLRTESMLGIFAINGWWNLASLALGMTGLLLAPRGGRAYSLLAGALLIAWGVAGFAELGGSASVPGVLQIVPTNSADDIFHLVFGLLGLIAAAATPRPLPGRRARPVPQRTRSQPIN